MTLDHGSQAASECSDSWTRTTDPWRSGASSWHRPGMSKSTTISTLTPKQARRALYVDFEGRMKSAPVLLGCTRKSGIKAIPMVWQAVTDRHFESLAGHDGIEMLELADAVERILQRAEARNRLIVAWSEHELDVVRDYCPEKLGRFQSRYVNARYVAVHWRNKCHDGQKPASNRLSAYLALIGHEVPGTAGPGNVGTTIARLRKSLDKASSGASVTANQWDRWGDLREHNRHDCAGMRKVCLIAATEVAASRAPVARHTAKPNPARRSSAPTSRRRARLAPVPIPPLD